ncbi:MAG TPA: ATP-binding protein, partial [Cellulomonas sp.]
LTNALKHAPHARVDLDVRAAPGDGVHVRVRNPLPDGPDAAVVPGSGTGLVGMRERAATVGGTVTAGPEDGAWVVLAHLPWPADAAGGPTIGA